MYYEKIRAEKKLALKLVSARRYRCSLFLLARASLIKVGNFFKGSFGSSGLPEY